MKSFKQFINEESGITPNDIVDDIMANCQPYLKESDYFRNRGMTNLWRGIEGVNVAFTTKQTRIDRKPQGMNTEIKELLDDALMEKFGLPFRSKAAFTTGDSKRVELFGNPYAVFPIGNFDYLWSPKVHDLNENPEWGDLITSNLGPNQEINLTKDQIKDFLDDMNYMMNENLEEATVSGNEIMVAIDEYYIIERGYFLENDIPGKLVERMR